MCATREGAMLDGGDGEVDLGPVPLVRDASQRRRAPRLTAGRRGDGVMLSVCQETIAPHRRKRRKHPSRSCDWRCALRASVEITVTGRSAAGARSSVIVDCELR